MSAEAWAVVTPKGTILLRTCSDTEDGAWSFWCRPESVANYVKHGYRVERVTMLTESEQSARDAELAELRQMLLEAEEGIILRDAAAISLRLRTEKAERKLAEAERRGMQRAIQTIKESRVHKAFKFRVINAIRAAADTKERTDG